MVHSFRRHPEVEGLHAVFSASKYSWIRYDDEKVLESLARNLASVHGTRLHAYAAESILLGQKLPDTQQTVNMYVNDALGFRMKPEVVLYYSPLVFGTADAISFREEPDFDVPVLRIHDLKTGVSRASFDQLKIYAAFFCLEYDIKPGDIYIELRVYQNDFIQILVPEIEEIIRIMDQTVHVDRLYTAAREEALA